MQKSYNFLKNIPFIFLIMLPISGQGSSATDAWCWNGVECPDVSSPEKLALAINDGFKKVGESSLVSEPTDETPTTDAVNDDASSNAEVNDTTDPVIITDVDKVSTSNGVVEPPPSEISEASEIQNDDPINDEGNPSNDSVDSESDTEKSIEVDNSTGDNINSVSDSSNVGDAIDNSEPSSDDNFDKNAGSPNSVPVDSTDKSNSSSPQKIIATTNSDNPNNVPPTVESDNIPQKIPVAGDELATPSTTTSSSSLEIKCPAEPKILEKNFTLRVGDKPITQKFLGEQSNLKFIQVPNGQLVTLLADTVFYADGGAKITFEARDIGKTNFSIGNCFKQTLVKIEVLEPLPTTCQTDQTFPLQPEQPNITMNVGETRTLWFTGGQAKRWLSTAPASEIITLESPEFPEEGGAKLKLIASQAGTTQLAISDCGEKAVINITVVDDDNEVICSAFPLKPNKPDITLVLGESAMTQTFVGDEINLTEPPDDAIVILDLPIYSENGVTQLKLTPRQAGKTQLSISNCASSAVVNITVLKPDSLAYFCWLDENTKGICKTPNDKLSLNFNGLGLDVEGTPIDTKAYFEGFINTDYDSLNNNLIVGQTDKASAHFNIIVDEAHLGRVADIILYAERQANNGIPSQFFMYNGRTWQAWDADISSLVATKHYDDMPLITELNVKLDSLLGYNTSGEFILNVGYRLNNGHIILNENTARFWIANSDAYPPVRTRAYFAGKTQWSNRSNRTQQNVTVTLTVKPDNNHTGEKADIILVALVPIGEEMRWYMQLPSKKWIDWDGEIENLVTTKSNVVLIDNLKIEISGDLTGIMGKVTVYIGYRMENNLVVFNGMEPVEVMIP